MNNEEEKKFYVITTPIGNLGDITLRALKTLKEVDLVLCEDTRVTRKLLDHYGIKKPLLSYHQRSKPSKTIEIIEQIRDEMTLALVTDAGTPGISDPGNELIEKIIKEFGEGIQVIPIPGPSALTALAQVAAINMSKFTFLGFPPHKKGRETYFISMLSSHYPLVYFDSPHRFLKNLQLLSRLAIEHERTVNLIVGRELTKMFEQVKRGAIDEVVKYFTENEKKIKGEFVIIADIDF
ncbi:MAG: 16S rRNA (cytidine(1402)-2'-O)-methyltransferase [Patescibacteria group bacterium]|nr:16S rRNA (cytidine(1402)-2'-O)-methyltransferase [Patescibacteria group bacterium]